MGRKARDRKQRPEPASAAPAPSAPPPSAPKPRRAAVPRSRRVPFFDAAGILWMAGLVAATLAVYASALGNPFLLDDPVNITKNPVIQKPLSLHALAGDPRAIVTASLRWNYLAGGFTVTGYHVLNVIAHALTGILVFALARATLRLDVFAGRYTSVAVHVAGVVALLFLLHPMQTESVTYVIQRAEVFVSAALAGALLSLVAMQSGPTRAGMSALAASCVFGMYSKPSFAVVPALLAVYDFLLIARGSVRSMTARWPAYALASAAALITFALTRAAGSFTGSDTAGFEMEDITPASYLAAQPGVVVHYMRRVLWPADLCFDCGYRGPWPVLPTFLGDSVALPLALLAVAGAASIALLRRQPLFAFAFAGTAVVLAPTSSVVPLADFYVEHRMYLPVAFVALALVPAAWDALSFATGRLGAARWAAAIGAAAAAVACAALAVATVQRNALLAEPIALMEDALEQAPQSERLHYNLANALKREGRLDEAEPHYREAIRLLPHIVRSYQNLGSLYLEQGKLEAALEVYLAGAAAKPGVAMAHRNVANTYLKLGRPREALEAAERALALEPGSPNGQRLAAEAKRQLGVR